jgi:hypothetical protein
LRRTTKEGDVGDLHLEYERVSRRVPCPVCGKPDWCLIARDRSTAICARSCEGSEAVVGEAGYKHRLTTSTEKVRHYEPFHPREEKRRDFGDMAMLLQQAAAATIVKDSAERLGVSVQSLRELGVGFHAVAGCLSFPMYDEQGVCGIRLRRIEDGFKYAMIGTKNGVFYQAGDVTTVVIVEGPTDAAAALTMGFASVVGRPFCKGGNSIVSSFLSVWGPDQVIIVADTDAVGLDGATKLADQLCDAHDVRLIEPTGGAADMRAWLRLGATKDDVLEVAANVDRWRKQ